MPGPQSLPKQPAFVRIRERYKENELREVTFVPAQPDDTSVAC